MRSKCQTCRGKGFIEHVTTCPRCKGTGKTTISIGQGSNPADDKKCKQCNGNGKFVDSEPCPDDCDNGYFYFCDFCSKEISESENNICEECKEDPYVVKLIPPLKEEYLDGKRALLATISKISNEDVFVYIGARSLNIHGQFKTSNSRHYNVGQTIGVNARKPIQVKEKWINYVSPIRQTSFKVITEQADVEERTIKDISESGPNGVPGEFMAQILSIKHLKNGPTFFTFIDKNGDSIQGTAFASGQKRAFISFDRYSVVTVTGIMDTYKDRERFLLYNIKPVPFETRQEFYEALASSVRGQDLALDDIPLSIETEKYSQMKSSLVEAAKSIRKAIISGRNVLLRYHSPCVDGATAAFAIDYAIRALLRSRGRRTDEFRYLVRRLPLKSPVYEASDIIRDISFVLDGPVPGEKMPLVVMIDAGSSNESLSAYQIAEEYDLPTIIIDHHQIDEQVKDLVSVVVNPMTFSSEYRFSSSMLAFELARYIFPMEDISGDLYHLAAIGALSDKVSGEELDFYLSKVKENEETSGLTYERMSNLKYALDYVLFGLRFSDGGEVVRDILQIGKKDGRADATADEIAKLSKTLVEKALVTMEAKAEKKEVGDFTIQTIDLENFAPRFEFPTHGLLVGELHDKTKGDVSKILTLGIGTDYIIFRASNIEKNLETIITGLKEKVPLANITGGGHSNVGTINFLIGFKSEIIETISELLN